MRAIPTSSIAAALAVIAMWTVAGHAQEQEQVKPVFEHATPNVAGKSLVAVVVTYAPVIF
jgi:hypothetical protein